MRLPKRTVLFFVALVTLVVFLAGINIGKNVEKTNFQAQLFKKLRQSPPTPTPHATPSASPSEDLTFDRYVFENCGVSFILPSTLTLQSSSTEKDKSFTSGSDSLRVSCDPTYVTTTLTALQRGPNASESAQVGNITLTTYIQNPNVWTIRNRTGIRLLFEASKGISELVRSTLKLE